MMTVVSAFVTECCKSHVEHNIEVTNELVQTKVPGTTEWTTYRGAFSGMRLAQQNHGDGTPWAEEVCSLACAYDLATASVHGLA
mmetsp:Transcript_71873/g.222181  ORF Transcript_71873/g.222181 Transcript_71873/m.222181 type:complete len:84 (+) Transcript_71873:492-743(+)